MISNKKYYDNKLTKFFSDYAWSVGTYNSIALWTNQVNLIENLRFFNELFQIWKLICDTNQTYSFENFEYKNQYLYYHGEIGTYDKKFRDQVKFIYALQKTKHIFSHKKILLNNSFEVVY